MTKDKTPQKNQFKRCETKRSMILADGSRVELDALDYRDCANYQKKYRYKTLPRKLALAETYKVPDYMLPPESEKGLNERQKHYKENVFTKSDLDKPLPKKVKSKNRQGIYRYIFVNELRANINGFLYYTIPLLLNIIFLIFNIFRYNFWSNMSVSVLAIIDFLALRAIMKSDKNFFLKLLFFVLLIAANVGLYYLGTLIPGFYESIYLPYTVKLFLISCCIYYFGKFYVGFALCYYADCNLDFGNTVQINAGKPRCGKTSTAVQDAFVLAKMKWQQLQYDYMLWSGRSDKILKSGTRDQKLELREIEIAYNFYVMRPCIPCLWSNIGIFDRQGRAAHKITIEHLKGIERLPVYSVVLTDEIGAILKADDGVSKSGHEKPLDVSDMFRLGGHFVKWVVIGCEQDFNHIYIDCRRVVGFNRVIHGQEWVCRPTILYTVFKFIKWCVIETLDNGVKKKPKLSKFMYKFEKFVRSIGFRRIKYSYASNTETGAGMQGSTAEATMQTIGGVKARWCAACLIAEYDDRAYKQKYPSYFDKEIRGELHKAKHIDGFDKNTAVFVSDTTALLEKRNVLEKEIEKIA